MGTCRWCHSRAPQGPPSPRGWPIPAWSIGLPTHALQVPGPPWGLSPARPSPAPLPHPHLGGQRFVLDPGPCRAAWGRGAFGRLFLTTRINPFSESQTTAPWDHSIGIIELGVAHLPKSFRRVEPCDTRRPVQAPRTPSIAIFHNQLKSWMIIFSLIFHHFSHVLHFAHLLFLFHPKTIVFRSSADVISSYGNVKGIISLYLFTFKQILRKVIVVGGGTFGVFGF